LEIRARNESGISRIVTNSASAPGGRPAAQAVDRQIAARSWASYLA
jgi:hypothetical protein